jgi:hypothetical protein
MGQGNMRATNRAVLAVVFVMVALNSLFLFGNGLFMLVDPMKWYLFVPGVTSTDIHPGPCRFLRGT